MRKLLVIAMCLLAAGAAFAVTLISMVNSRGGLSPQHADLARLPVLGPLLKVRSEAPEQPPAGAAAPQPQLPAGRQVPFLRFGAAQKLARLAEELDRKQADYDLALQELQRRTRELGAWEQQIKKERDSLRARFDKEKQELARTREELASKEAELSQRQLLIEQQEEANLKATAEIYGKMSPDKAASVLGQMYGAGQQETVVKIIYLMQPREAAKVLEAFSDPKIGAAITEQLKRITRSQAEGG